MIRLLIILLLFVVLALPAPVLAQELAGGVIIGQVVNDTEGGTVGGVEVTLITYIDNLLAGSRNVIADNDGGFSFEKIDMEHTYLVSVKYRGVDYYYQVVFEPGETTVYVTAGVCEVTTDDEAIRIGKAHTVIELDDESFLITGILWLFNDGNRTFTGMDSVLVFSLPDGAFDFEAPQGLLVDYIFLDNNRLTYLVPFPPGERQLIFSYRLVRPDNGDFTISFTVDYPTDSLEVMVTGENMEVSVDRLAPADPVFVETGERFIHFEGANLQRGSSIEVTITGLSTGPLIPIFVWIIIATVVAGAIIYLVSRRIREKANER